MRRAIGRIHRWTGLGAGLFVAVVGLSGSALVFRDEIDVALEPGLRRASTSGALAPVQQVVDSVARAYPFERATRVRMPRQPGETYEVWLGAEPSRFVYVDPHTARVLGARRPTEFLTGWLFLLHSRALGGEWGKRVVGVVGIALLVLTSGGVAIWWPGRRGLRGAVSVHRGAGAPRLMFDLHRAVGFYASIFLLVAALTGISLVFPDAARRVTDLVTGTARASGVARPPARSVSTHVGMLSLDTLLAIAERAQPKGAISYLYLPDASGAPFRVRKQLPTELHPNGKSFVTIDPRDGRVLRVEDGSRAQPGARLYDILYPIHTGVWGGRAGRLLAVFVGLMPAFLATTGLLVWWRRTMRRRSRIAEREG